MDARGRRSGAERGRVESLLRQLRDVGLSFFPVEPASVPKDERIGVELGALREAGEWSGALSGGAQTVLTTKGEWTAIAVDMSGRGDAGAAAAVVNVYALTAIGRVLVGTGTLSQVASPERVLEVSGVAAIRFEVEVDGATATTGAVDVSFIAFGDEPAGGGGDGGTTLQGVPVSPILPSRGDTLVFEAGVWMPAGREDIGRNITLAEWTPFNPGIGTVVTDDPDGIWIYAPAHGGDQFRGLKRAVPATPYTRTWRIRPHLGMDPGDKGCGVAWRDSVTDKLAIGMFYWVATTGLYRFAAAKYTTPTTWSGTYPGDDQPVPHWAGDVYLRVSDDGATRRLSVSRDGRNFIVLHGVGRTDFLTPDELVVFVYCAGQAGVKVNSYV